MDYRPWTMDQHQRKMRLSLLFLLTISLEALYAQSPEKLEWHADRVYEINPHDTAFGFHQYHLRALSYTNELGDAWTIALPKRMQQYMAASIYDKSSAEGMPARKLSPDEANLNHSREFLKCPEVILHDVIAIADRSGFLLLDKKQGAILADLPDEISNSEDFYVDSGHYEIKVKNISCEGTLQHGADFISSCAGYLFHFSGSVLYVFDKKRKLIARTPYVAETHGRSKGASHRKAVFNSPGYSVIITGRVYLQ